MKNLKPCPFCGSVNVDVQDTNNGSLSRHFTCDERLICVVCYSCCATAGFVRVNYYTGDVQTAINRAIDFWNMRADEDAEDEDV